MRVRAASTSEASTSAPSPEPSSGSTACSGWGMRPMTLPSALRTPATSATRRRSGSRPARSEARSGRPPRARRGGRAAANQQPSPCLTGIVRRWPGCAARGERRVGPLDAERDVAADEASDAFGPQDAGQEAGLAEDLEAVADPEHEPAVGGEVGDGAHDRREAGDRAAAQVVAVGEAAGEDDCVDARAAPRRVPDERRRRRRALRAPSAASRSSFEPGKTRTPIAGPRLASRPLASARARSRSSRSAGWRAAARTCARPAARASSASAASTSRSTTRPTRASPTAKPRWRSELSTACPCGSRMPVFGPDEHGRLHREHHARDRRGTRRTGSRSGARTPRRSARACRRRPRRGARGRARVLSQPSVSQ